MAKNVEVLGCLGPFSGPMVLRVSEPMKLTIYHDSEIGRLELSKSHPLGRWRVLRPDGTSVRVAGSKAAAIGAAVGTKVDDTKGDGK